MDNVCRLVTLYAVSSASKPFVSKIYYPLMVKLPNPNFYLSYFCVDDILYSFVRSAIPQKEIRAVESTWNYMDRG